MHVAPLERFTADELDPRFKDDSVFLFWLHEAGSSDISALLLTDSLYTLTHTLKKLPSQNLPALLLFVNLQNLGQQLARAEMHPDASF